jgi:hypothetical protein
MRPERKAHNLTATCEPIVKKMWEPRRLTALWASTACYRDTFTLPIRNMRIQKYRCSRAGAVTDYRLVDRGVVVRVPVGAKILSSPSGP